MDMAYYNTITQFVFSGVYDSFIQYVQFASFGKKNNLKKIKNMKKEKRKIKESFTVRNNEKYKK